MSKPHRFIPLLTAALLVCAAPVLADYSLVWSDEFEGTSLDTADWTCDVGDGCPDLCGWGNSELQYYREENVTVADGMLTITAQVESYGGRSYTSGKIHTAGKQSFLYGRIEMRAQLPYGDGMWPAFWMMPAESAYGVWAASGEIDIMESANEMTTVGGTIHFGGTWPDNTYSSGSITSAESYADDFHVYAVEWEPDVIRWYVDDTLFSTKTSAQWWSSGDTGNDRAPFDEAFYIILNCAVGGTYTGCTSASCVAADLPQEYRIDYVRVYQDTGNLSPTVLLTSPTEADAPAAGDIEITAEASDSDGTVVRVEFYDDETYLGEDDTAPFTFTWTGVADGCYALTARAIDDGGAEGYDVVDLTVGSGCGQVGYPSIHILPTTIEAEDYDAGGAGVAYADGTSGNTGGAYRTEEDVDVQTCSDDDGGYNVGWIDPGEWLEYTLLAPASGTYPVDVRVASLSTGGAFRLEVDGVDLSGEVAVPATGGWQAWENVSSELPLELGVHVLRFVPLSSGFNLNFFEVGETTVGVETAPSVLVPVLWPAHPNPFNPSTTLAFELPVATRADLVVHDVAGRRVRTLVDGVVLDAGLHRAVWNGRDDTGRIAPAGVYFCRLVAGGRSLTTRLVMVK